MSEFRKLYYWKKYYNEEGDVVEINCDLDDELLIKRGDNLEIVNKDEFLKEYKMRQYLVIQKYDNGYTCGCCNLRYTELEYFSSQEEAVEYAKKYPKKQNYGHECTWIAGVYEVKEIDY